MAKVKIKPLKWKWRPEIFIQLDRQGEGETKVNGASEASGVNGDFRVKICDCLFK